MNHPNGAFADNARFSMVTSCGVVANSTWRGFQQRGSDHDR
ncbi:hypothetical protein [Nocardia sp. NPDC047654]